jgi:hypothetical protein
MTFTQKKEGAGLGKLLSIRRSMIFGVEEGGLGRRGTDVGRARQEVRDGE